MTRTEIIQKMADVVDEVMKNFQTDFTKYDKPAIENAKSTDFPFMWIVSELHTRMVSLGGYEEDFFNNPTTRYAYADGDDGISFYLHPHLLGQKDRIFLIRENYIWEVNVAGAKNAIKDYTIPVYRKWKKLHGEITPKRVTVQFDLIELPKLREIIRDCHNHNDDSLMDIFRHFHKMRRVADDHKITIRYHAYSNEFACVEYYNGKEHMIRFAVFHGWPETGYQQNGSVQIDPRYGWASHT